MGNKRMPHRNIIKYNKQYRHKDHFITRENLCTSGLRTTEPLILAFRLPFSRLFIGLCAYSYCLFLRAGLSLFRCLPTSGLLIFAPTNAPHLAQNLALFHSQSRSKRYSYSYCWLLGSLTSSQGSAWKVFSIKQTRFNYELHFLCHIISKMGNFNKARECPKM